MHFKDITDTIVEKICKCSTIEKEKISKALNVYKDNKTDFVLFFNQISSTPTEDAQATFDTLQKENFIEIKDLSLNGTCIGFNLNKELYFKEILSTIFTVDSDFGKNKIGEGQTVIVEFSSPNIAKIFHVGHYRNTILGNFVKNLMVTCGFKTISMNYLGDWGKQFGLVLLGFEKYGSEEKLKKDALVHLFDVYVMINKAAKDDPLINEQAKNIFKEMEENRNEKYLSKWRLFREMSIEKYKELYMRLNIEFDIYSGESFYHDTAKKFAMNTDLAITDEDGSKVIDCGSLGKALIMKSDGTTLYLTRDICAAEDRIKSFNPNKIIYVVSNEQDQHLKQLFHSLSLLGYDKNIFEHINYGYVKGMSTRNGTVHFLEDIISTSVEAIKEKLLVNKDISPDDLEHTALILAISTLLIADFSAKRIKGYTFNFDQRANCEKGSGAYLQYAHCRLNSIEEVNTNFCVNDISEVDFGLINCADIHDLAYKLIWYEKLIELCLEDYEPSRIVIYLMDLCKQVNNLIGKLRVKGEEEKTAKARLFVLSCARKVIRNGLVILGITPLKKM